MDIVKTKIEVTIYGEKFNLSQPKSLQAAEFIDSISEDKKLSNTEMIKKTQAFIVSMGLPEEVCDSLELDHLNQLIGFITKKK